MAQNKVLLRFKDYQIIENAQIVVEGITALVGSSNNGKTSLYKAVKTALRNIAGSDYIRTGSVGGLAVGVIFDFEDEEKFTVVFQKNDTAIYTITPENKPTLTYEKLGRRVPKDIEDMVNMSPLEVDEMKIDLNFADQLSEPLLMKLSDTYLFNATVKSFNGEKINQAIKIAKKALDDKKRDIADDGIRLEENKKSLLKYIENEKMFSELTQFKNQKFTYKNNKSKLVSLQSLNQDLINKTQLYDKAVKALFFKDVLEKISKLNIQALSAEEKLNKLKAFNTSVLKSQTEFNGCESKLTLFTKELDGVIVGVKEYEETIDRLEDLGLTAGVIKNCSHKIQKQIDKLALVSEIDLINKEVSKNTTNQANLDLLVRINESISRITNEIGQKDLQLKEKEAELTEANTNIENNICPFCKSKMTEKDEHMEKDFQDKLTKITDAKKSIEAQKTIYENQLKDQKAEIVAAGFDPEKLDEEIKTLKESVEAFEAQASPVVDKIYNSLVKSGEIVEDGV